MNYRVWLLSLFFGSVVPSASLAHPGGHDRLSVGDAANHIASSPFHMALYMLGTLLLGAAVLVFYRKLRAANVGEAGETGGRSLSGKDV